MRSLIVALLLLLATPAFTQQQISTEQLYRNINAALAQDNSRLGAEKEQLTEQLAKAQARIKELEKKPEEKK